jgi:protocadherin Fat 4
MTADVLRSIATLALLLWPVHINREADGASRSITIRATSTDGSYTDQVFSIAINDVDEFDVGAVSDTDATSNNVNENASVGTVVGITACCQRCQTATNKQSLSIHVVRQ